MPIVIRLLMWCDYTADPLWTETEHGDAMYDLDALPLSKRTRSELRAWAGRFDESCNYDGTWDPPETVESFDAEGRRLWEVVRRELGPKYEVEYASHLAGRLRPS